MSKSTFRPYKQYSGMKLLDACSDGVYNEAYKTKTGHVYEAYSEEANRLYSLDAIEEIKIIVQNGDYHGKPDTTQLDVKYTDGKTPLILASMYDKYGHFSKVAELLIESGADLDIQDKKGMTALMGAIWNAKNPKNLDKESSIEIAKLLIKRGANLKLKNSGLDTAYDMARDLPEIRKAIIEKDSSFAPKEEMPPLSPPPPRHSMSNENKKKFSNLSNQFKKLKEAQKHGGRRKTRKSRKNRKATRRASYA
jgi:hypothetical protein